MGGGAGDQGGVSLVWGASTDVGNKRKLNEDSMVAQPPVFVVADGMGGYEAGEIASALTVELLRRVIAGSLVQPAAVARALVELNREIHATGAVDGERAGMGTTVVGAVLVESGGVVSWLIFNVGDSRVYCVTGGELRQISKDHSYVQELVDEGRLSASNARKHPERNVITRALGASADVEVDYWIRSVVAGERFLLCSDGLTSEVDDLLIGEILRAEMSPQDTADALVLAALEAGGRDNVTVIVVDVLDIAAIDGPTEETRPVSAASLALAEAAIATRSFDVLQLQEIIDAVPLASAATTPDPEPLPGDDVMISRVPRVDRTTDEGQAGSSTDDARGHLAIIDQVPQLPHRNGHDA
jgi:protein phosphatase